MKAKASADILIKFPGHTIPGLMPKMPTYAIPESKWSAFVVSRLMGDFSFSRLWKNPVHKSFFYHQGMAVFSSSDDGSTLTNVFVSYARNQWCPKTSSKYLHYVNIGKICVTNA
ncbi:hypothetical protein NPIL_514041 [Nephila pilipes]|uniref:Uncharacterized protein n=1 Tax=Nephila pilipes TaxID=299642 RepID=A0A8X6TPJ8_NEPPI|nr:hypothetical protein NPIL_514041 [Nephila pilipes]